MVGLIKFIKDKYRTAFSSRRSYCHLVWNFCKSSDSGKIERVQECSLRAINKSKTETY